MKPVLKISIKGVRARKELPENLLRCRSPCLDNTTLISILLEELGVRSHVISGPTLERFWDTIASLLNLLLKEVLLINEVHHLN